MAIKKLQEATENKLEVPSNAVLGIDLIDLDHQKVFGVLHKIQSSQFDRQQYIGILEVLEDYILTHFSREEDLMLLIRYPRFEEHLSHHKQFVRMFEEVWNKTDRPNSVEGKKFVAFIEDWWHHHIEIEDRKYSEWLRRRLNSHKRESP